MITKNVADSPLESTVLVAKSTPVSQPNDPDRELRAAIEAALVARDFERVKALVAVLEVARPTAPLLAIASKRRLL